MGRPDGFLVWSRVTPGRRPVPERVQDWRELVEGREPAVVTQQAGRCMDCGVPFCHQACPLGNRIPDFQEAVYRGEWERAWRVLSGTNNLPEITGRLCPAPCESACVLAIDGDAVTIEQIEKEIAERGWDEGWEVPRPPRRRTGHHVAIVGSGPAGLAAAQQLCRAGHAVTVFEKADRAGGLLRYGIPEFKLEKAVIERRLDQLRAEGVIFRTGVHVGRSPTWDALRATHDAVLIATGAERPRELDVPGRALVGVVQAMAFLTRANRQASGESVADGPDARGRRVIVLGGGDTGSDCVGTAHRQGAASVMQLELMPEPPSARPRGNPWPRWPLVRRTSSSHEEGGDRAWGLRTTHLEGRDGRLTRLHAEEVALREGRLVSTGRAEVHDVDLLVLAMGFTGAVAHGLDGQLGVTLDTAGRVPVTGYRTVVPGVYAAGDASRGASLIVWAIAEGREAARVIDADLVGRARLAARGMDLPPG